MKRVISEQRLNSIISEAIREAALRNTVKRMVVEELNKYAAQKINEDSKKSDDVQNTRQRIKALLNGRKGLKYTDAQLAYHIWPNMDKDTARSLFSKMVTGEPDADGNVREFSDDDVTKLDQFLRAR